MRDHAEPLSTFIRGPRLRERWNMSNSTFYRKLAEGAIPKPRYPFGGTTPYWSVAEIEEFEKVVAAVFPAAKIVIKRSEVKRGRKRLQPERGAQ